MHTRLVGYHFVSSWVVEAPLIPAERAIYDVTEWRQWWPDLVDVTLVRQTSTYVHSVFQASWRSAAGYVLTIEITIQEYRPGEIIRFTSHGDLQGEGEWTFKPIDEIHTAMHITWNVQTTKNWMNRFAVILKPIFKFNHALLMARAERGLNGYLQLQKK